MKILGESINKNNIACKCERINKKNNKKYELT